MNVNYLFIGGPQRSGTTGLGHLLNAHPSIALGIERYKYLYPDKDRQAEIGPALFESGRFFAFSRHDTNINSSFYPYFDAFKRQFPATIFRGDKLPMILNFHSIVLERFPGCRFIFIYRDPYRTAASWNARGKNPNDRWPENRDYRKAVVEINELLRIIASLAMKEPERYLVVSYNRIFDRSSDTLTELLRRLDLPASQEILSAHSANWEKASTIGNKPLMLDDEQRYYVRQKIDWRLYETLDKIAVTG